VLKAKYDGVGARTDIRLRRPCDVTARGGKPLAEMIGTTRSRVSFFLNRFRDLGFINYNGGGMHVHSSLVSVVLHD
jgi:CRP/FNR family cyclic AMP-dependent transcriptional regulator